jgi:hypothetical protein
MEVTMAASNEPERTVTERQLTAVERLAEDEDNRIAELATTARDNIQKLRDEGRLEVTDAES